MQASKPLKSLRANAQARGQRLAERMLHLTRDSLGRGCVGRMLQPQGARHRESSDTVGYVCSPARWRAEAYEQRLLQPQAVDDRDRRGRFIEGERRHRRRAEDDRDERRVA